MKTDINHAVRLGVAFVLASMITVSSALAAENGTRHDRPMVGHDEQVAPRSPWCAGYKLAHMSQQQRLSGHNLNRLRAAQSTLAPSFEPETVKTGLYLLADYQELLEKRRPDVVLAASYLALASTVPITAVRYREVNALLCVSTTKSVATSIQKTAESLRQQDNIATLPSEGVQP